MSFNFDNQQKTLSGKASNLTLAELLQSISKIPKLNITISKNYSVGYEKCEKQFKMDYQVCFHDFNDEVWLIKSTSSIRSDRIYGNEFFAQNIKLIDSKVTNIFVVIPDSVSAKEIQSKKVYSKKIHSNTYVSFIDDVLTLSELHNRILSHASKKLSQGISANILGESAEDTIVNLLNDTNNILLWNDYTKYNKIVKSSTYQWFVEILLAAGFTKKRDKLKKIFATKDIPKLINGGYPKTDVAFTVTTQERKITRTISVKNTSATTVTVHEGDITDVITALKISSNSDLAYALQQFQSYGSEKFVSVEDPSAYDTLTQQLHLYNKELIRFFIFGVNSPLINDNIQIADMILYMNNFEIFDREVYINYYLREFAERGQLGTPFKWTYPSKKRGRKIQIKGFTNNTK